MNIPVKIFFILLLLISHILQSNSPNSLGSIGINFTPTARFLDEGSLSFNLSRHDTFSRGDLIAQPYDWLEFSIFYADIPNRPYYASLGAQSYKDKGFNMKVLLLKENTLIPQLALGLGDFAGTGLFSSEYIVGSKKIGNLDLSLGVGWGLYSNQFTIKNPFRYLSNRFDERNYDYLSTVGKFDGADLFSGSKASIFGSVKYQVGDDYIFIESNPTNFTDKLESVKQSSNLFLGYEKKITDGLVLKLSAGDKKELNLNLSSNFNYSTIKPRDFNKPKEKYEKPTIDLISALQSNGIALKNIKIDDKNRLMIGVRQNSSQNRAYSNKTVMQALNYSEIDAFNEIVVTQYQFGEEISKDAYNYETGNPVSYPIESTVSREIYELSEDFPRSLFLLSPSLRTMIASREGFLYYGLMIEANYDVYFSEKFYVTSKTTYSLSDNFDGLYLGPVTTFPAQVRSDIKDYLKNLGDKPSIERLEFNYLDKIDNHYFSLKGGLLETMFSGIGMEYLNYDRNNNYAFGLDIFSVKKRDYTYDFSTLDYEVITGHINFFHYLHALNLTSQISYGKYLAGDKGFTFDFSRRFENGTTFGAFFSLTDVSFDEFGEGSFDKGVYVKIPIGAFGNNSSGFKWRPLTKDPAQKLNLSTRIFDNINRYIY